MVLLGVLLNNVTTNARLNSFESVMMKRMDDLRADTTRALTDHRTDTTRALTEHRTDTTRALTDLRTDTLRALTDLRDVLRAEMAKNQSELLSRIAEIEHH